MKNNLKKHFYDIRRKIARRIVPEFYWPKEIFIDNTKIKLRGTPYAFGVKLGLKNGTYEVPERNLLQFLELKGEKVIEMGGSIGILTAILANKVGDSGRIISVEASKKLSCYSRNWLEKNIIITVITGFAFPVYKLKYPISIINFDESGTSLTGILDFKTLMNVDKGIEYDENLFDLNRICDFYKIIPTMLVVDIEGSEKILIEQQPEIPATIKFILIELHPFLYGVLIQNQIIEIFKGEGFFIKSKDTDSYLFERAKYSIK